MQDVLCLVLKKENVFYTCILNEFSSRIWKMKKKLSLRRTSFSPMYSLHLWKIVFLCRSVNGNNSISLFCFHQHMILCQMLLPSFCHSGRNIAFLASISTAKESSFWTVRRWRLYHCSDVMPGISSITNS